MVTINLKGREIPLVYTTLEMLTLQEEIGPLGQIIPKIMGRNPDDEEDRSRYASPDHLKSAAKAIRILGNAGLEVAGKDGDLTDKWVMRAIRPADLLENVMACLTAMDEGMQSEIPKVETTGPVDVVLEQIERKKEPTG